MGDRRTATALRFPRLRRVRQRDVDSGDSIVPLVSVACFTVQEGTWQRESRERERLIARRWLAKNAHVAHQILSAIRVADRFGVRALSFLTATTPKQFSR